jgi:hypothetical protein
MPIGTRDSDPADWTVARNHHFLLREISAGIIEIGGLQTTDTFNKPFRPYRVILYLRGERWG